MPNPREEMLAASAARFAKEELRWRQENPGKVRFYLVSGEEDPPTFTFEGQSAIREVISALKANKIEADMPFMVMDSVEATSGYTGEIAVLIQAVSPILTGILAAWLQSKAGRKVRLKVGDIEVEARTVEEADQLLQRAQALQASQESAKDQAGNESTKGGCRATGRATD
jgi:hypothetical protein